MMIFTHTSSSVRKTKMSKKQKDSLDRYNEWRKKNGLSRVDTFRAERFTGSFTDYKPKQGSYRKTDHIKSIVTDTPSVCARTSIMDPINLNREPEHVREAILLKSKRIAQMYNKGGYQYITDDVDIKTIGTRNRRM